MPSPAFLRMEAAGRDYQASRPNTVAEGLLRQIKTLEDELVKARADAALAREQARAMRSLITSYGRGGLSLEMISFAEAMADARGLPLTAILSANRKSHIAVARSEIVYEVAKAFPNLTMSEIGRTLGLDHTTVLWAIAKMEAKGNPPLYRTKLSYEKKKERDRMLWVVRKRKEKALREAGIVA